MRLKQLHISLLLGYLVLFWNLGPSLHRAEIFGLHCHSCCSSGNSSCCHDHVREGHWHSHGDGQGFHSHSRCCDHEHSPDPTQDQQTVTSHHECSLCEFFDNFNVVFDSFDFEVAEAPSRINAALPLVAWLGEPFSATARGPPAA